MSLGDAILGKPLPSSESKKEELSVWTGVPVLGLDALASTGYGPEAALTVLAGLGVAGLHYFSLLVIPIVLLLASLYFSYRQTAEAYPGGEARTTSPKIISEQRLPSGRRSRCCCIIC
jgi:hypothetical protein